MKEEMYSIPEDNLRCSQCNAIIVDKVNCVPNIMILTEESDSVIVLDMKQALGIIDDYCYRKYYHLSASQIVLYRPDIACKAFKRIFKNLVYFGFEFSVLCKSCYDKHIEKHPLK